MRLCRSLKHWERSEHLWDDKSEAVTENQCLDVPRQDRTGNRKIFWLSWEPKSSRQFMENLWDLCGGRVKMDIWKCCHYLLNFISSKWKVLNWFWWCHEDQLTTMQFTKNNIGYVLALLFPWGTFNLLMPKRFFIVENRFFRLYQMFFTLRKKKRLF